jgi:hypothetical protein
MLLSTIAAAGATTAATAAATATATATDTATATATFTSTAMPTATATTSMSVTASLAFDTVAVGQTVTRNATVTNTGAKNPLIIASATASDLEYALTGGGTCGAIPVMLAPKTSCTLAVAFTPSTVGAHSASLTINDNAITSPKQVTFSGTGRTTLTTSVTSLAWGNVTFGKKITRVFVLTNHQTQPVTLSEGFGGTNAADFSITGGTCTTTLGALKACTLIVSFTPSILSGESATLTVGDSPDPLGPYTVALSTGAAIPAVTASPLALAYGTLNSEIQSKTKDVTVTSKTPFALPITETLLGTNANDFSVTGGTCGTMLQPDSSCTIAVTFAPTGGGIKESATLEIEAGSELQTGSAITLTGTTSDKATPTPSATATPTATATPPATPTATCTPQEEPTPYAAGLVLIAGGQGSDGTPLNSAEVFNPKTNTFTLTTDPALGGTAMNDSRYRHAAAVASDNSNPPATILLSGGIDAAGATSTTETFSSSTNQFAPGDMSVSREGHTETELLGVHHTHSFLIAGGEDADGTILKSAEGGATMNVARLNAASSTLQTYDPLERDTCTPSNAVITGGFDEMSAVQSAEVFNPTFGTFTLTDDPSLGGSQMHAPRMFHTATPLENGLTIVLVAGGEDAAGVAQSTAEIFDPATNKFTLTTDLGGTNMTVPRAMHTATRYGTSVLIAGGVDDSGKVLATAEVYNAETETFTAVGSMNTARFNHAAAALPNGEILITGGEDGSGNTLNTAEIFDPTTNTFTLTTDPSLGGNNMNAARKLHTATAY